MEIYPLQRLIIRGRIVVAKKQKSTGKPRKKIAPSQQLSPHVIEDIFVHGGLGICIVQDGRFVFVSPQFQKYSGYSSAEILGRDPFDIVHPDDKVTVRKKTSISLKSKNQNCYEYRVVKKNGEIGWVLEVVLPTTYKSAGAALGSLVDITEHKHIKETLRQTEEKYRAILEGIEEGYYEEDFSGNFTFINDSMCRIYGYSRDELMGMNYKQYTDAETAKNLYQVFNKIYKTGEASTNYTYELIRKDGTRRYIEASASLKRDPLDNPIGFRGIVRDVTRRKKMEDTIRQSEERYRTILDEIQEGYFENDLEGNLTFFNESFCRLFGYPKEKLIGMNYKQYTEKESIEKVYRIYVQSYRTGEPIRNLEQKFIKQDGSVATAEVSASQIKDSQGNTIGFRGICRDITKRKRLEESLQVSEEKYRTIFEEIQEGYFENDLDGNLIFLNESFCKLFGYARDELVGLSYKQYTEAESAKKIYRAYLELYRTGEPVKGLEQKIIRKDGSIAFAEISASLIKNSKGENVGFRGICRDITDRKLLEETVRQSEERYRTIIEEMEEWYFEADIEGKILFFNGIFANVLGRPNNELGGVSYREFVKKEDVESFYRLFHQIYVTGMPVIGFPYEFVKSDGTTISAELSIFPKRELDGKISGFRGLGHDVTERKRTEERIQFLATHDALTGLPNRMLFNQLLSHGIQNAKRHKRQISLLFIDLDRFKMINDSLGHEAGDQLLQEIARRMQKTLRAADVIARLGGDEFVILIEEVNDANQVSIVARRILSATLKPIVIMEEECRITASIGISMFPKDATDDQSLMKYADMAMYLAKEEGKNNFQFYAKGMKSIASVRLSLETNLRSALERNELSLHYQAKLDFSTNAITGVEALLRWQNPQLGSVPPVHFIPVAEETGLIIPIGRWVLKTACEQNVSWQRQGLPPLCIAVNLSLRQLMDENLIKDIERALNKSGLAPNLLELEITESMVMHNPARMISILSSIKEMGVRLAIDDFGTGYSSLAHIKNFPIDTIKVDRSFIRNLPEDSEDMAITEAIIAMGKTLSLTVVAEGVETAEQIAFLRKHACNEMQGYYFSKPITGDQFTELLRSHGPSPIK